MLRNGGLALLAVCGALAQMPIEVRIDGHVLDSVTGAPVRGVRISFTRISVKDGVLDPHTPRWPGPSATSDVAGAYSAIFTQPGTYNIEVEAEGYVAPILTALRVTPESPNRMLDIRLLRRVVLTGRLVDESTRKPVAGARAAALMAWYRKGHRMLVPHGDATTNANGEFRIPDLPPGEYVLEFVAAAEAILPVWQPDYTAKTPRPSGFRRMLWPSQDGAGLTLRGGEERELGEIRIAREPLFRIRGSLDGFCAPGDQVQVALGQQFGYMHLNRSGVSLPCGSKFTATNLAPGLYQLQAWLKRKPLAQRAFSYREIAVETDDVDAVLQTVPPVLIRGKVRPNVALAIGLRPLRGLSFAEEPPIKVAEDGAFRSLLFPQAGVEVEVSGVAAPQYVRSILYNGARAPGGVFEPDPYALEHLLEVVVANDGARLHGQVTERGDAVAGARVAMVPWPQVLVDGFPAMVTATCDAAGRFSQAGLAPGAYRVFAYREADAPKLDLPGVVSAQAGSASEVTLPGGGTGTVTLEPAAL